MHLLHRSSGEGEVFGGYAARDADEPGVGAPATGAGGPGAATAGGSEGNPPGEKSSPVSPAVSQPPPPPPTSSDDSPPPGTSKKARRRWYDRDWDAVFPLLPERLTRQPRFVRGRAAAVARTKGLLYVAERQGGVFGEVTHKQDHLACFLPGLLALGHGEGLGRRWGGGDAAREAAAARSAQSARARRERHPPGRRPGAGEDVRADVRAHAHRARAGDCALSRARGPGR